MKNELHKYHEGDEFHQSKVKTIFMKSLFLRMRQLAATRNKDLQDQTLSRVYSWYEEKMRSLHGMPQPLP